MKSIVSLTTCSVAGVALGRPLTDRALLNHRVSPAGIFVPLKLPVIDETVDG